MATVRDILGADTLKFETQFKKDGLSGKDLEDAMINLARDTRKQRENNSQTKVEQALNNSVYTDDGVVGDVVRGVTTGGIRLMNLADGMAESVGFDLVDDNNAFNKALNVFEKKKEQTSREGLSPERLAELDALAEQSANAKGFTQNLKAGIDQMVDVALNPDEWTFQGAVEMVTDPLNALSFGAGGLAGKFGKTLIQKVGIGAGAGALEGATINSGAEYLIAKGQGQDANAGNIAIQSAGGGAVAGAVLGGAGGAMSKSKAVNVPDLKEKSVDDILNNDLLKTDPKPGDIPNPDEYNPRDFLPDYDTTYKNLPAVIDEDATKTIDNRFETVKADNGEDIIIVSDNVNSLLNELVEVELVEPEMAKQIEYKNKTILLGNKDVIYADMQGWSESVGQHIIDAINAKKIRDVAKAEIKSKEVEKEVKVFVSDLVDAGNDTTTIRAEINKQFTPSKEELALTLKLNNGMPIENRFSGLRLRNSIQASINNPTKTPEQFKDALIRAGASEELANVSTQSYLNKNLDLFDEFVNSKTTDGVEAETKAIKQKVEQDLTVTEDMLEQWFKDNPVERTTNPEILYRKAMDEYQSVLDNGEASKQRQLTKLIKKEFGEDGLKTLSVTWDDFYKQVDEYKEKNYGAIHKDYLTFEAVKKDVQSWISNNQEKLTDNSYAGRLEKAKAKVDKYAKELGVDTKLDEAETNKIQSETKAETDALQNAPEIVANEYFESLSPVNRGKVESILSKEIDYKDAGVMSRKDFITSRVMEDNSFELHTVLDSNGKEKTEWGATNPDGSYTVITKTEADFGNWMKLNKVCNVLSGKEC